MTIGILRQALASYLFIYITVLTVVLGAMLQVMIAHLSGARWFDGLRPRAMQIVRAMPIVALFALPILIGAHALYPWADLSRLPADAREVVERKHAWLNMPFFLVRAVIYLGVWCLFAELLRRRDTSDTAALRRISAAGAIVVGITMTFAAFDWVMSLEPSWYSTIYGIYLFAGGILSALALIAFLEYRGVPDDRALSPYVMPDSRESESERRTSSIGKLLFTFAIFWAYIAFSQYVIVWIGNLPSEVTWYVSRTTTGWLALAILAGVGQFVIPFLGLIGYGMKRRPRVVTIVAISILIAHVIDVFWLVMPAMFPAGFHLGWTDFIALAVIVIGAVMLMRDRSKPTLANQSALAGRGHRIAGDTL